MATASTPKHAIMPLVTRSPLTSELVQAVYLGDLRDDGGFLIQGEVEGTAFSIAEDVFVTAGHVVRTITASDRSAGIGLTSPSGNAQRVALVRDSEELQGDVGLVKVEFLDPESRDWHGCLRWNAKQLQALQPVVTFGYPYGIHHADTGATIVSRAFSGHVVSTLESFKPLGSSLAPFRAHEISFGAPRGLSGSPLFTTEDELLVGGVVIGNSKSQMLILQAEEVEETNGTKTKVEQYESLSLGVATAVSAILPIESRLLGNTIRGWLESRGAVTGG